MPAISQDLRRHRSQALAKHRNENGRLLSAVNDPLAVPIDNLSTNFNLWKAFAQRPTVADWSQSNSPNGLRCSTLAVTPQTIPHLAALGLIDIPPLQHRPISLMQAPGDILAATFQEKLSAGLLLFSLFARSCH